MINCNPETVSTDFDTADKLYFEPVFWEISMILYFMKSQRSDCPIGWADRAEIGGKMKQIRYRDYWTSYEALDLAEDRGSFSTLLKEINIPIPSLMWPLMQMRHSISQSN